METRRTSRPERGGTGNLLPDDAAGRASGGAVGLATLRMERVLWARGHQRVAGVDEVGRGPLAGPVVAAAVVLPQTVQLPGVNDSKKLTKKAREAAYELILRCAADWSVAAVAVERIDAVNIRNAALEAMARAVLGLPGGLPDFICVDGNAPISAPFLCAGRDIMQRPVVGGDRKLLSIAAASVVAKVTRDRMALEWDRLYPEYGFARHKGYATVEHLAALARLGPCPVHRRSFLGGHQSRRALEEWTGSVGEPVYNRPHFAAE